MHSPSPLIFSTSRGIGGIRCRQIEVIKNDCADEARAARIFASSYELHVQTVSDLKAEIRRELRLLRGHVN